MKKLLYGLIGLVIVLVAAVFVVPALIDWNSYKEDVAAQVKAATGRDLVIAGDISVTLLPSPRASVSGVSLSNMEGGSAESMMTLDSASADIAFWPLLGGDVQVDRVTLVVPQIVLETSEDGAANWDFAAAEPSPEPTEDDGDGFDMRLDRVVIEDGSVRYVNAGRDVATLQGLNAELSAQSLGGPFAANGTATLNALPFEFDAGIGVLADSPQFAVRIITEAGAGEASVDGRLMEDGFDGTVVLAAEDGEAFVEALARAAGEDFEAPDMLAGQFALFTELTTSPGSIAAEQLSVTLGESQLTGHARLLPAEDTAGPSFDVALSGEQLDVDAILVAMEDAGAAAPQPEPGNGFTLPTDVSGRVALALGAVTLMGDTIGDVVLDARLSGGTLSFDQASMTLPGGSPLRLQGTVAGDASGPRFSGSLDLSSSNPRGLLGWAGIDASAMPQDTAQSFALSGTADAGMRDLRLDPFTLTLDDSTATGSLALALADLPSVTLTANIDRFNADRYIGAEGGRPEGEADGDGSPFGGFDADVRLTFGRLTVGGDEYSPVTARASVRDGGLSIEELSGAGPGGTAFSISGTVSDPATPAFAIDFDLSHPDLPTLLTAFGLDAGGAPAVSMAAAGAAESDGTTFRVSDLRASLGDSDISGSISAALGDPVKATAQLHSNVLNLDALLPGGGDGSGGSERWSSEPLNLASLQGVDAEIEWTVGRLAMAPVGLDDARLSATLTDGVLTIDELTGAIGGGPVAISARLDTREGPSMAFTMTGDGVRFAPGVLALGDVSLDGAQVDLNVDVTSNGGSAADLIGGLDGTASLSVDGGVINGLRLGAWRETINGLGGDIASLSGVLGTLSSGFEQGVLGGQTPIGSLSGQFQIQGGEVYTDDLTLRTDSATVEMEGGADLSAWTVSALGSVLVQQVIFDNIPAVPFGLGGSLDSPNFQPDLSVLQLFLGTDVMGLSLDQLPADILSGLPIQGLTPEMLQGVDPRQLIDSLATGRGALGPDAFRQFLQDGADGGGAVPQPDDLLQQFLGGGQGDAGASEEGAAAPPQDPAAALRELLDGGEVEFPENEATREEILELDVEDGGPEALATDEEVVPNGADDSVPDQPVADETAAEDQPAGEPMGEEEPSAETAEPGDQPAMDETVEPDPAAEPVAGEGPTATESDTAPEPAADDEPATTEPDAAAPAEPETAGDEPASEPEDPDSTQPDSATEPTAEDASAAAETGDSDATEPETAAEPAGEPATDADAPEGDQPLEEPDAECDPEVEDCADVVEDET